MLAQGDFEKLRADCRSKLFCLRHFKRIGEIVSEVSDKTKIKLYDVVNSLPVFVTVVMAASFVYFQGNANASDIQELKNDKKEILKELKEIKEELIKLRERK